METRSSHSAAEVPVVGELEARLDSLRRTIRRATFIGGAALAVRLACICLVVAFVIDVFWEAPRSIRIGLLAASAAAVSVVLFLRVIRPTFRRIQHDELAALVETAHPEMEERLLSSLELARSAEDESIKGSPLMREMLLRETARVARDVEFAEVVDSSASVRQTISACAAFLIVLSPFLVLQEGYGNLWARFFNPWGNYAHGVTLTVEVQPGDTIVPKGEDVPVTAVAHFRFGDSRQMTGARVRWTDDDGESEYRDLRIDPDQGVYSAMIPQVSRGLAYRVESDQGSSREFRVDVVDRPLITGLTVDVHPPAYCGKAAQRMDGLVGETTVFERSRLKFTATFNKPVTEVRWLWLDDVRHKYDDRPLEAKGRERLRSSSLPGLVFARDDAQLLPVDADGRSATWELTADREGAFEIVVLDAAGIQNRSEPGRSFRLTRDAAPTVAWADRETHPAAKSDDVVAFEVVATDDIGLGSLELHYSILPHRTQATVLTTDAAVLGGPEFSTRFPIDLRKLSLPEGALVAVKARAADERPIPGPNEAWTTERVITISRDAAAFGASELQQRHQRMRDLLAALRQEASAREEEAAALKLQSRDAQQKGLNEQVFKSQTDQLVVREEQLKERLQQTAAEFRREGMMATLSPILEQIAEKNVVPAVQETEKARDGSSDLRTPSLQNAEKELGEATQKLTQVEQRFEELAKLEKDLLELNRIADKTERLADDVAGFEEQRRELSKTGAASSTGNIQPSAAQKNLESQRKELQQEQRQLSKSLQEVLNRRPEVVEAARADLIERLKDLGQRAERLAAQEDRLAEALRRAGEQNAEQLKNEAAHQQELREQVEKLAAQVAAGQRQQVAPQPDLANVREAAEHLKKGNRLAAAEAQRQAAEDLERLAEALERNQQLSPDPQQAARELATRQQEIAAELEKVLARAKESQQTPVPQELNRLAAEQAAIQAATSQLEVPISNEGRRSEAINASDRALEEMLAEKPEAAVEQAKRAQSKLEQLANDVGTPEERAKRLANDAERLMKQQEAVANDIEKQRDDDRAAGRRPGSDPESLTDQARQQEVLARQAAAIDVSATPDPARAARQQAEAIRASAEALQKAQSGNAEEAAPAARKAEQALADLQKTLKNEPTSAEQIDRLLNEQRELTGMARKAVEAADSKAMEQAHERQQKQVKDLQRLEIPQAETLAKNAAESARAAARELAAARDEESRRPAAQQALQDARQAIEHLAKALQPIESPVEEARRLAARQKELATAAAGQAADSATVKSSVNDELARIAARHALDRLPAPGAANEKQAAARALAEAGAAQKKLEEAQRSQPDDALEPSAELKSALENHSIKQQSAAEALAALADQLSGPGSQQALAEARQEAIRLAEAARNPRPAELEAAAEAAGRLANEQAKLREEMAPLIEGLPDKSRQRQQIDSARQAQQKLVEKIESLNPGIDPLTKAEAEAQARAAEESLAGGDPANAARQQAAAETKLNQLAQSARAQQSHLASAKEQSPADSAPPASPGDPKSSSENNAGQRSASEQLARQARTLAEQQKRAAENLLQETKPSDQQLASAIEPNAPPQENDRLRQDARRAGNDREPERPMPDQPMSGQPGDEGTPSGPSSPPSPAPDPSSSPMNVPPGTAPAGGSPQPRTPGSSPGGTEPGAAPSPDGAANSPPGPPASRPGADGQAPSAGRTSSPSVPPGGTPIGSGGESSSPAESAREAVAAQQQVSQALAEAALDAASRTQGTPLSQAAVQIAKSAAQASENASVGATAQAAEEGRQLAQAAGELARQLEENPVAQGGPQPELAGRMRALAAEQQQTSRQLGQIAGNPQARNAAQSQGQLHLKNETRQLESEFAELSEKLKAQPVDRKRQAEQARDARSRSEGASREMQQAMETARKGDSADAAAAARSAAKELRQAARMAIEERGFEPGKSPDNPVPNETGSQIAEAARELQKAGDMLARNEPPQSGDPQQNQPGDKPSRTDASDQAAEGAREGQEQQSQGQMQPDDGGNEGLAEGQQDSPPQASEMLKQGAHSLRKAASQLKLRPGQQNDEGQEGGEQGESQPTSGREKHGSASGANEQVRIVDIEAHLEKLSTRNWGELPGKLQTEILQSTRRRPDGDYAPLIRRYFDTISRPQGATDNRREN